MDPKARHEANRRQTREEEEVGEEGSEVQRFRRESGGLPRFFFWFFVQALGLLGIFVRMPNNTPGPCNLLRSHPEPSKHHLEPSQGSPSRFDAPSSTWSLTKHHLEPSQAAPGASKHPYPSPSWRVASEIWESRSTCAVVVVVVVSGFCVPGSP